MINVISVKQVCKMFIFTWYVSIPYISNFPTVNILI